MSGTYLSSAMNILNNAAHAVAPSFFEDKTEQTLSPSMRGKMSPYASPSLGSPSIARSSIPIPPPLPTEEAMHKHYLIPLAPPMPNREQLNKHYLSRDRTLENAGKRLRSAYNLAGEIATDLVAALPSVEEVKSQLPLASLGLAPQLDENGIPIPPALPTEEMMHKHYLIPLAPPQPTPEDLHKHVLVPKAPALPTREMMHKHYLIPLAPPMPTKQQMNKHYLSRDRTVENLTNSASSAINYASEVVTDLKDAVIGSLPSLSTGSIPAPPPQPTKEMMHKHYLTRPAVRSNRALPADLTAHEREVLSSTYSPQLVEEQHTASPMFTFAKMRRAAMGLVETLTAPVVTEPISSQTGIPIPPPLPTREMMHKHYLIPLAPPVPTKEQMNKHYMARDKTIENATSYFKSAVNFVSEVASEVKDYVMETPISEYPADLKERLAPTPTDEDGIPIPPALPTREMMHKHYLVPVAPPMPTKEQMHKHYLSRDRTVENVTSSAASAITYAGEVASDYVAAAKEIVTDSAVAAKDVIVDSAISAKDTVVALPAATAESAVAAKDAIVDSAVAAKDVVVDSAVAAKDVVVEKAVELKEKVLPTPVEAQQSRVYSRSELISESPILRKNRPAGARRITSRKNYEGFKPLLSGAAPRPVSLPSRI